VDPCPLNPVCLYEVVELEEPVQGLGVGQLFVGVLIHSQHAAGEQPGVVLVAVAEDLDVAAGPADGALADQVEADVVHRAEHLPPVGMGGDRPLAVAPEVGGVVHALQTAEAAVLQHELEAHLRAGPEGGPHDLVPSPGGQGHRHPVVGGVRGVGAVPVEADPALVFPDLG